MFFINGSFIEKKDAAISILDLGLLRGYGAFEFLRTYGTSAFHLEEHIERFFYSLKEIELSIPYSFEDVKELVLQLIRKSKEKDIGIKLIATGGLSPDQFLPKENTTFIMFTTPLTLYADHYYNEGIETVTTTLKRCLPMAKTTMYLPGIVTLQKNKFAQEALYLNSNNEFLEATTSNLFFIRKETLITSDSEEVLFGVTRELILQQAKDLYPIHYENLPYSDLSTLQEAFICATNKEIMPVVKIDGRLVGNGKVGPATRALMQKFQAYVNRKNWTYLNIKRHESKECFKAVTF